MSFCKVKMWIEFFFSSLFLWVSPKKKKFNKLGTVEKMQFFFIWFYSLVHHALLELGIVIILIIWRYSRRIFDNYSMLFLQQTHNHHNQCQSIYKLTPFLNIYTKYLMSLKGSSLREFLQQTFFSFPNTDTFTHVEGNLFCYI